MQIHTLDPQLGPKMVHAEVMNSTVAESIFKTLMVQCCNLRRLLVQQRGPLLGMLKWPYGLAQTSNGQQLPHLTFPLLLGALKHVTLRSGSAFLGISWV